MCVDDQVFNLEAIKILLTVHLKLEADEICETALNGQIAFEKVISKVERDKQSYLVILMDI